MLRYARIQHRFVQNIPETLEPGIIYISIEYATAIHLCCCGCGEEVVTPITPTDWKLTFDGDTISLSPSIGNWNYACRSHYFIDHNLVLEALPWSRKRIEAGRKEDEIAKRQYFDSGAEGERTESKHPEEKPTKFSEMSGKIRAKKR